MVLGLQYWGRPEVERVEHYRSNREAGTSEHSSEARYAEPQIFRRLLPSAPRRQKSLPELCISTQRVSPPLRCIHNHVPPSKLRKIHPSFHHGFRYQITVRSSPILDYRYTLFMWFFGVHVFSYLPCISFHYSPPLLPTIGKHLLELPPSAPISYAGPKWAK